MKVYFAHPCFNDEQREFKETFLKKVETALADTGLAAQFSLVDPFEHTPNVECDRETKLRMAEEIKTACLRLLEECDVIVALTDWDDTGTAFEAGYAHATDKPIILISRTTCSSTNAMLIGSAHAMIDDVLDDDQVKKLVGTIRPLILR